MKYRNCSPCTSRLSDGCSIDPISLFGKRIRGKAHALRLGLAVQLAPVQIQSLDPHLQQFRPLAAFYPLTDSFPQLFIITKYRQRLIGPLDLATVESFNDALSFDKLPKLRCQLLH